MGACSSSPMRATVPTTSTETPTDMAKFPVNPRVVQSARNARNLSQEDAAARAGLDLALLRSLEDGEQQPTLGQLRKLAKAYGFPLATLGHPNPIQPPEPLTDFRTVEGRPAEVSADLSIILDEARQLQEFVAELREDDERLPALPELPAADPRNHDPEALAQMERERLGFSAEMQLDGRSTANDIFNFLRTQIEDLGAIVYVVRLPLTDCRGFFLLGDEVKPPLIGVNGSEPMAEAMIFTLIHEYCHALRRAPGISGDEVRRNPTEWFCNQFTANFLMPPEVLREVVPLPGRPVEWERDLIRPAARRIKVSQQALVLRLEQSGNAPHGFFARWVDGYEGEQPPPRRPAGPVPWERRVLRKFGTTYTGLVLDALQHEAITPVDVYRLLKVKPKTLEPLRQELAGRRGRVRAARASG